MFLLQVSTYATHNNKTHSFSSPVASQAQERMAACLALSFCVVEHCTYGSSVKECRVEYRVDSVMNGRFGYDVRLHKAHCLVVGWGHTLQPGANSLRKVRRASPLSSQVASRLFILDHAARKQNTIPMMMITRRRRLQSNKRTVTNKNSNTMERSVKNNYMYLPLFLV